jgi:hypothetical protein
VGTTKRTRMTVETHRVVVVSQGRRAPAWCEHCSLQVDMVRVDEAAAMASVSSRTIYLWVETGNVHFTETPEGFLLICSESLAGASR